MNSLQLGILFGLGALLFGGLANSLVKVPTQKLGANKTIFYRNVMNGILLLIILCFTLNQSTFDWRFISYTLLLAFLGYVPMYFFYRAMALGKVGIISPVASGNVLIAVLIALLILNEKLSTLGLTSIFLIILGIVLISINFKEFKTSDIFKIKSGIPYALIAAFGWGIWFVLSRVSARELGPFLTAFIIEAGAIPVAYFLIKKEKGNLKIADKKIFYYIIPLSVMMVLWSLSYYQGVRVSNMSIVVTLSAASPLVVALYGRIFYKEKLSLLQYFSIALIITGVVLLSSL